MFFVMAAVGITTAGFLDNPFSNWQHQANRNRFVRYLLHPAPYRKIRAAGWNDKMGGCGIVCYHPTRLCACPGKRTG